MKFRFAALAATFLASTASFAGVVTGSSNIDFLAIDGQKPAKSMLKENHAFNVNDTQKHQVVVRESEIIQSGSDRVLFESDPIVVAFQGTPDDIVISAPRLQNERDVNAFKQAPIISVKTPSGRDVANQQEDLSEYNASGAPAAVAAFAGTAPAAVAVGGTAAAGKVSKGKVTLQGENVAEQMLQYWYQQADKETQARFIDWAKKQK